MYNTTCCSYIFFHLPKAMALFQKAFRTNPEVDFIKCFCKWGNWGEARDGIVCLSLCGY